MLNTPLKQVSSKIFAFQKTTAFFLHKFLSILTNITRLVVLQFFDPSGLKLIWIRRFGTFSGNSAHVYFGRRTDEGPTVHRRTIVSTISGNKAAIPDISTSKGQIMTKADF